MHVKIGRLLLCFHSIPPNQKGSLSPLALAESSFRLANHSIRILYVQHPEQLCRSTHSHSKYKMWDLGAWLNGSALVCCSGIGPVGIWWKETLEFTIKLQFYIIKDNILLNHRSDLMKQHPWISLLWFSLAVQISWMIGWPAEESKCTTQQLISIVLHVPHQQHNPGLTRARTV